MSRSRAFANAAESRFEREILDAERAKASRGSLNGVLIDHDPVTGEDIFETPNGGTVKAGALTRSGVPRGTSRNLQAGTGSGVLYFDETPVPPSQIAVQADGVNTVGSVGGGGNVAEPEQIDVAIDVPENRTYLITQSQRYQIRIAELFSSGYTVSVSPSAGSTVAVGGTISLLVSGVDEDDDERDPLNVSIETERL